MFKLVTNPEFSHTVKVRVPVDSGYDDLTFTARFRALSISEAERHNTLTSEGTNAYLREILVGWEGVVDDVGEAVSFNAASRERMIDVPFVRMALLDTYHTALLGAKRGN